MADGQPEVFVKVLYDYDYISPNDEQSVVFKAGEEYKLISKTSENWWYVCRGTDSRYVPAKYVEEVKKMESPQIQMNGASRSSKSGKTPPPKPMKPRLTKPSMDEDTVLKELEDYLDKVSAPEGFGDSAFESESKRKSLTNGASLDNEESGVSKTSSFKSKGSSLERRSEKPKKLGSVTEDEPDYINHVVKNPDVDRIDSIEEKDTAVDPKAESETSDYKTDSRESLDSDSQGKGCDEDATLKNESEKNKLPSPVLLTDDAEKSKLSSPMISKDDAEKNRLSSPVHLDDAEKNKLSSPTITNDDADKNKLSSPPISNDDAEKNELSSPPISNDNAEKIKLSSPPISNDDAEKIKLSSPPISNDAEKKKLSSPPISNDDAEINKLSSPPISNNDAEKNKLSSPPISKDNAEKNRLSRPTSIGIDAGNNRSSGSSDYDVPRINKYEPPQYANLEETRLRADMRLPSNSSSDYANLAEIQKSIHKRSTVLKSPSTGPPPGGPLIRRPEKNRQFRNSFGTSLVLSDTGSTGRAKRCTSMAIHSLSETASSPIATTPVPVPVSPSFEIPQGYQEQMNEKGEKVFINTVTNEKWKTLQQGEGGKVYYYNITTHTTAWSLPPVAPSGSSSHRRQLSDTTAVTTEDLRTASSVQIGTHSKFRSSWAPGKASELWKKSAALVGTHRLTTLTAGLELPIAEADGSMLGAVTPEEEVLSPDGKGERPARKPLQPKMVEKQGLLQKTKIAENGKKLKKNWSQSFVVLCENNLHFFKEQKSSAAGKPRSIASLGKPELVIDLTGAKIATSEEKSSKKDPISLITSTNAEFLIHCDNVETLTHWRQSLENNIAILEQGSTSLSSSKDSLAIDRLEVIFGSTLATICEKEKRKIPRFLKECIVAVENRGLSVDGIYRVSGNLAAVQKLRHMVDHNEYYDLNDQVWDIHTITGALKLFFRELSEPLFTFKLLQQFLDTLKTKDQSKQIKDIRDLVKELPISNSKSMKALFKHLSLVVQHGHDNRMQPQGLAIVFGPTLMWPERTSKDENLAASLVHQGQLVEQMIIGYKSIF